MVFPGTRVDGKALDKRIPSDKRTLSCLFAWQKPRQNSLALIRSVGVIARKERLIFATQKIKISEYQNRKLFSDLLWVALKLAIAFTLMEFLDYGIYIVIGYILYSVVNNERPNQPVYGV